MTIIGFVRASVFEFGPDRCDGMAIWARTGSNTLATSWRDWREKVGRGARKWADDEWGNQPTERNPRSLEQRHDPSLLELLPDPPPSKPTLYTLPSTSSTLKYLYLQDQDGGVATHLVAQMTTAALAELDRVGCKKVAMNGIHGIGGGTQSNSVDRKHATEMIASVRKWLDSSDRRNIEEVYLVNLGDRFLNAVTPAV